MPEPTEQPVAPPPRATCIADGIIYLSAPGDFFPSATQSDLCPPIVNGQPASYFWKDLISLGAYKGGIQVGNNGERKPFVLVATPERIANWHINGKKMLAAGLKVPAIKDHKSTADSALGRVIDFRSDDDETLFGLCQFIGEDAARIAARNEVSVGVCENYVDPTGQHWGDVVVHLGITPVPADPTQGNYIQAASRAPVDATQRDVSLTVTASTTQHLSTKENAMDPNCYMSAEHEEALKSLIPGAKDASSKEDLLSRAIQHHRTMAAVRENLCGGPSAIAHMSRADIDAKAQSVIDDAIKARKETVPALEAKLLEKDGVIQTLSANAIRPLDSDLQEMALENVGIYKEQAVANGLSPEGAERLFKVLGKDDQGNVNTVMLSRISANGRKSSAAAEVFKILSECVFKQVGERTGLQTLSRQTPDEAKAAKVKAKEDAAAALQKHAKAMATA
jgi:hypothetical protein